MNIEQALADIDKHALEFNFPVLDNAYVEFAAARMSGFANAENWLLIFEVLGFSNREVDFVDNVYAYGSCLDSEGFVKELIPIAQTLDAPLFDAVTNECIADWKRWSANVMGKVMSFAPTTGEYASAGIIVGPKSGPGTLSEIDLLRFLFYVLGEEKLFGDPRELLDEFRFCKGLQQIFQTTRWQHPDIAGGEKPSDSASMRSALLALSACDSRLFDQGRPNTTWVDWVASDEGDESR